MNNFLLLAAQIVPEALVGGAGWVGAGLLGLVLWWLLYKHLPAKDKQIKEFIEGKDLHIEKMTARFEASLKESRIEFRAALDAVLEHCTKEMTGIAATLKAELADMHRRIRGG